MPKQKEVEPARAVAGEVFRHVRYSDGKRMPAAEIKRLGAMIVVAKEDRQCQAGVWACLTHGQIFENNMQKDSHIHGKREPCTLGWFCAVHGEVEEP